MIMLVCSVIIAKKTLDSSKNISTNAKIKNRRGLSRNKQLLFILFTTNSFFVCLISPLVCFRQTFLKFDYSIKLNWDKIGCFQCGW